jgi:hypothetical protein
MPYKTKSSDHFSSSALCHHENKPHLTSAFSLCWVISSIVYSLDSIAVCIFVRNKLHGAEGPSSEANIFSASQEIPRILWNPKVHYRIQKCPPPLPILSQLNTVHTLTSHFRKIHFNIFLSSTPGCYEWSLSLGFPHKNRVYVSRLPRTCYISRLSHSSRFYHLNHIGWGVQIIKLLII